MSNIVSSHIFHIIIFYEPYKESASGINPKKLCCGKSPNLQATSWSCFPLNYWSSQPPLLPLLQYFRKEELAKPWWRSVGILVFLYRIIN